MASLAIVHKTIKAGIDAGLRCVISDSRTPDVLKDIVGDLKSSTGGWIISNYVEKNPIVLFNNLADFPCGTVQGVRWKDGQLLGNLVMAPEGTSTRHDELRKLIQCGVVKSISCGFRPIESVPLKSGGRHFLKQELVTCSLMAIGCHPDALLQAKSMGVSTETIRMIFKSQNEIKHYTQEERAALHRRAKEKLGQVNPAERDHGPQSRDAISSRQALESKLRKAEAALARAKSKPLTMNATIAERIAYEDFIAKYNKHLRTLRRAQEVLARTTPREVISWRGKKIPLGHHEEREPKHRWEKETHRWDKESHKWDGKN
jgi:hypothetical protein